MNAFKVPSLVALVALAAGCEPVLFSAEIDAQAVCVSGLDFSFPGLATEANTLSAMSAADLGTGLPDDIEIDVEIIEVGVQPMSGTPDLSFLQRLAIQATAVDQSTGVPDMEMLEMTAADQVDNGLRAEPAVPVDISTMLGSGNVIFAIQVDGDLPESGWEGTMDLCVHTRAKYSQPL
jgi:hypothetical protein